MIIYTILYTTSFTSLAEVWGLESHGLIWITGDPPLAFVNSFISWVKWVFWERKKKKTPMIMIRVKAPLGLLDPDELIIMT